MFYQKEAIMENQRQIIQILVCQILWRKKQETNHRESNRLSAKLEVTFPNSPLLVAKISFK